MPTFKPPATGGQCFSAAQEILGLIMAATKCFGRDILTNVAASTPVHTFECSHLTLSHRLHAVRPTLPTTPYAQVETVRLLSCFFSAAQQGASLSAMLAESASGAFLATSTLRLLCVVTSERSTKVENLIPQICTLALDEIAPCAQQEAHMADLLPPFLRFTQVKCLNTTTHLRM